MAPPKQDYFFSLRSVSAQQFHSLLDEIRSRGWENAYSDYLKSYFANRRERRGPRRKVRDLMLSLRGRLVPGVVRAILCRSQAYHWLLTGLDKQSVVLDLGAGWSAMSHVLAEESGTVVAADVTLERLQFSSLRAATSKVPNMCFVRTPAEPPLPFADGTFDLVVINGVLEWVGASTGGRPEDVQRRYLEEVARILKPSGQVIIGIENRYAFSDLMGFPEGHVGLPFVGVVPRVVGDAMSRVAGRGPLRVATHSGRGLKTLLANAGFDASQMAVYAPQPTYSWYDTIGGFDQRAEKVLKRATLADHPMLRKRVGWLPEALQQSSRAVVGAFYAVAGKSPRPSGLEKLCAALHDVGLDVELPLSSLRVREHKVTARAALATSDRYVRISIGMSQRGDRSVRHEHATLALLSERTSDEVRTPRPLRELSVLGHVVSVLEEAGGQPLRESSMAADGWADWTTVLRFLRQLRTDSRLKTTLTIGELWRARWNNVFPLVWDDARRRVAREVEAILRPTEAIGQTLAPFGHGDLLAGNLLRDDQGRLTLIDWESAGPVHPDEDAATVLLSQARARHDGIGPALVALLDAENGRRPPRWLEPLASNLLGSDADFLGGLVMAWLGHVAHANESYVQHDPEWLDARVWKVVDALAALVGEAPGPGAHEQPMSSSQARSST